MNHDDDWESNTLVPDTLDIMSDAKVSEPDVHGEGSADRATNVLTDAWYPMTPATASIVPLKADITELAFPLSPIADATIQMLSYSFSTLVTSYVTTQSMPDLRSLSAMATCSPVPPSQNTTSGPNFTIHS